MPPENERDIAEELGQLLLDIMILANPPGLPDRYASVDSLQILHANLMALRDFLLAASNGDLSGKVPFKGFLAGTLKALQSNLRHLAWQTEMVASGDFSQRVDFMGQFAQSFNAMVIRLDHTLKELVRKETEISQTNEELLREIAMRKETEAALRESEESLRVQAITDPLTALFNRRHFFELAQIEIERSFRHSRPYSLLMFDIDFFKRVNDSFGHSSGDVVLQTVAKLTKEKIRTSDIPARYGGEEFVVFLAETSASAAVAVAERLRKGIERTFIPAGKEQITVTASFGISDYFTRTDSKSNEMILLECISGADQALYSSKHAGRNRITVYSPPQNPRE